MTLSAQIVSLGEIARRLDVPIHRVEYVIRTRSVKPTLIAGGRHFYSEGSVQRIGSEIKRIDKERGT
jgi:hypothetical protein